MRNRILGMACVAVATLLAFGGCSEQGERLNAPPQGASDRPTELQKHFIHMTDNAMLSDASIADIHFEPHSAYLSGLGVKRLARMAELMDVCGGTIYYETGITDNDLIQARLDAAREFLLSCGLDEERVLVEAGYSRGQGMHAVDAILIRDRARAGQLDQAPSELGNRPMPTQ